jgi:hypothetical protein
MKGMQGLILAVGLGIAGAVFNWFYLTNRSRGLEYIYFVGIKPDIALNSGDVIKAEQIQKVGLPKESAGNLKDFAVLYEANTTHENQSVVGRPVSQSILGGRLLLKDDLKTPRPEFKLNPGEEAMWVPIDTRSIVPSLIVPGNMVSFLVSKSRPGIPTAAPRSPIRNPADPVPDPNASPENPDASADASEPIGPFKVISIGNRLGSVEVMKSARTPQVQENVMTICVTPDNKKKALHLYSLLEATNFRQVGILLHSKPER